LQLFFPFLIHCQFLFATKNDSKRNFFFRLNLIRSQPNLKRCVNRTFYFVLFLHDLSIAFLINKHWFLLISSLKGLDSIFVLVRYKNLGFFFHFIYFFCLKCSPFFYYKQFSKMKVEISSFIFLFMSLPPFYSS
jgi:hypothetical protein